MDYNQDITSDEYLVSIEQQWLQQNGAQPRASKLPGDSESMKQLIEKEAPHLRLIRSA